MEYPAVGHWKSDDMGFGPGMAMGFREIFFDERFVKQPWQILMAGTISTKQQYGKLYKVGVEGLW